VKKHGQPERSGKSMQQAEGMAGPIQFVAN